MPTPPGVCDSEPQLPYHSHRPFPVPGANPPQLAPAPLRAPRDFPRGRPRVTDPLVVLVALTPLARPPPPRPLTGAPRPGRSIARPPAVSTLARSRPLCGRPCPRRGTLTVSLPAAPCPRNGAGSAVETEVSSPSASVPSGGRAAHKPPIPPHRGGTSWVGRPRAAFTAAIVNLSPTVCLLGVQVLSKQQGKDYRLAFPGGAARIGARGACLVRRLTCLRLRPTTASGKAGLGGPLMAA
eukprot:1796706-Rhodomonas_salina.1